MIVVIEAGIEPAAFCMSGRRSTAELFDRVYSGTRHPAMARLLMR